MSKNKLLNNVFLHEKYFSTFFDVKFRDKRLEDINNLSKFYSKNKLLEVSKDYNIDQKLLDKWIQSHKTDRDKVIARNLINPITYISFDNFYNNLVLSTKKFNNYIKKNNIKKYYLVIGSNTEWGTNQKRYINIEKSNFWTILIIYPFLELKPYDIVLNLNQALQFSIFDMIKNKKDNNRADFVFVDDASYSGQQLFTNTIGEELINKKYLNSILSNNNPNSLSSITKNNIKENNKLAIFPVKNDSNVNIHIIVPYISTSAFDLSNRIKIMHNINIYLYNNYMIINYDTYYSNKYNNTIIDLEEKYQEFGFHRDLTPLYFAHKMPDSASTIDYLLLSGIVVNNSEIKKNNKKVRENNENNNENNENNENNKNNKNNKNNNQNKIIKEYKYVQFINNCIYPKNKNMEPKSLDRFGCNKLCPESPAKNIKNKIYKIMFNK